MSAESAAAPGLALVTGGAGFIGSNLVDGLLDRGWSVRVLDDFSSGRDSNLAHVVDRIDLVRGDLCDVAMVEKAVDGVDAVFHQAAIASVPQSVDDPKRTTRVNLDGTLGLLEAARHAGVRRVVFAASSAAYGNDPTLPKVESLVAQPLSPYALQKYACEHYCRLYTELYELETVALRYFNVYGPRQDPKSDYAAVIPLFISAAIGGDPVRIYGDGEQTRDFVFVGDAVAANILAATAPEAPGQVINVANGRRTSINELASIIGECIGREIAISHEAPRAGDVRDSWADISRARELLQFAPGMELKEGLRLTVEAFGRDGSRSEEKR